MEKPDVERPVKSIAQACFLFRCFALFLPLVPTPSPHGFLNRPHESPSFPPLCDFLVAALKQALVTQLMSQEASERVQRCSGARILRTTSLRTPVDSRARVLVHNGSEKGHAQTEDPAHDLGSGDTGFFDSPEDYAGSLVLEGFSGPGESSTDDDIIAASTGKQLRASRGCPADSGINLRFSTTSQVGSLSTFSRQVLSHLRNLQANLSYLKEVEAKYNNLIRQRSERPAPDMDGNKDKR